MSRKSFHLIAPAAALAVAGVVLPAAHAQSQADPPPADSSAAPAAAAPSGPTSPGGTMYRWVDKDNTVHYSDRPQPGAESVPVQGPQTYSTPRPPTPATRTRTAGSPAAPPPPSCGITSPTFDQVFPNPQSLTISYRGPFGGTAQLQLSGTLSETRSAQAGQSFTISPIPRGTYTATVTISGEPGTPPCVTPPVTFHVRQPSVLSPVRQQMNRAPRAN